MKSVRFLALWAVVFTVHFVAGRERITLFESLIQVNKDATLTITERLHVTGNQDAIRHGIIREFPTRYKDRLGNNVVVGFNLVQILKDGAFVPHKLVSQSNGYHIYIGDAERILAPGQYLFELTYTTNRQLGFFKNHDELYWNVTGTGWRLPIDRVKVRVVLPQKIDLAKIAFDGYTGYQGDKRQNYQARVTPEGVIEFETTVQLRSYQGLTIVAAWPKGIIIEPSWQTKLGWFVHDNQAIFWLVLALILLLIFYVSVWQKARKTKVPGTVIPFFYPPEAMEPAELGYLSHRGYKHTQLAATVVDMAVKGFLQIKHKDAFWGGQKYTLIRQEGHEKASELIAQLYKILFSKGNAIVLLQSSANKQISQAIGALKNFYVRQKLPLYLDSYPGNSMIGGLFSFLVCVLLYALFPLNQLLVTVFGVLFVLINILFWFLLKTYTPEGRALQDKIDGFKMFLETTERDRLTMIGTPPTKTPELFETYLPYAIALGVERQWSAQFAPIFAQLEHEGQAYQPVWYVGRRFDRFDSAQLGSTLSRSFSSTIASSSTPPGSSIASSSTPPGSSSGLDGRGSSGGGGGGGGGGGW